MLNRCNQAARRPPSPCLVEKYVSRSSVQKKSWLGRRAPCHAQAPVYQAGRCTVEILRFQVRSADCVIGEFLLSVQNSLISTTVKLRTGHVLVSLAQPRIFWLFMNGKFDTYLLWPLAKRVQNQIVARSTVCNNWGSSILWFHNSWSSRFCNYLFVINFVNSLQFRDFEIKKPSLVFAPYAGNPVIPQSSHFCNCNSFIITGKGLV